MLNQVQHDIFRSFPIATQPLKGGGKRVVVERAEGTAKRLRKDSTDTERYLWKYLGNRQIESFKFRRQQPVGSYVVDFVNFEKKVVIELDGGQHALNPGDKIRDKWLRAEGYRVLRFWDNQVFSNIEGVLETIRDALLTPHPCLPAGRLSLSPAFAEAASRRKAQGERGDNF